MKTDYTTENLMGSCETGHSIMRSATDETRLSSGKLAPSLLAGALTALLLGSVLCFAQQGNEKTFVSPGAAALALYNAAKSNDNEAAAAVLGSHANDVLHTGDAVADKNMGANFVEHYDKMHRVVLEPDGTATLYIGVQNWPFPIPIAKNSSGAWYFDTEAGKQEILYRRIGRNENDAIDVLHSLVAAQKEYASAPHDGSKHYAAKFLSDDGKQNGLYWKTGDDETPSPIGPLLVSAAAEGYGMQQGKPQPFHGYYYRILTKQGPAAKGGAKDYMVNGQLTKGFAFVAYPAAYQNSGVMTFIVNQDGVVYESDLGADIEKTATGMTAYNPDSSWKHAE
jgi:Protein of unknown function (DUF2950)